MTAHTDDCLMVRYLALSDDAREWWPEPLGGRPNLCTCGANPDSQALLPDLAEVVEQLREHVEAYEVPAPATTLPAGEAKTDNRHLPDEPGVYDRELPADEREELPRLWPPDPAIESSREPANERTIVEVRYGRYVLRQFEWVGGHTFPIEDDAGNLLTLASFAHEVADEVLDVVLCQNGLITDEERMAAIEGRPAPPRAEPFRPRLPSPDDPE